MNQLLNSLRMWYSLHLSICVHSKQIPLPHCVIHCHTPARKNEVKSDTNWNPL